MTPKEYLSQAFSIDRKINLDIEKARAMRASLYGRAVSYESDGSQHVSGDNHIENAMLKVVEYEEKINAEIDELVNKRLEIEKAIKSVDDEVLQEILTRRYLQFQKWERIAVEMHLDLRWVYRLHGRALEQLTIIDH
ncbi:MAG: hypothetical protein IJ031_07865 [Oscillospiraceae bacterium]|nr:hypothetical protein [Oscillospiraceae bacterium]MBQ8378482.1 hypothetical protein [Oscillospiraceae bacterium]MBQ8884485.1 hypothetical protein [Oscillospiraceae bacterium]